MALSFGPLMGVRKSKLRNALNYHSRLWRFFYPGLGIGLEKLILRAKNYFNKVA